MSQIIVYGSNIARRVWNRRIFCRFVNVIPALCVAILLLNTFRLYKFAYFGADAFNNLQAEQTESLGNLIRAIVNPVSLYFRPIGMLYYWLFLRFFDLDAGVYRWLMWSLHTANTALAYFLFKRVIGSRAGAAVGTMLFASQAVFADVYFNFGAIFELLACLFCFVALLLWTSDKRTWPRVVLATIALFLSLKSKEMAVTMPLVFALYDLLFRRGMQPGMMLHWIAPGALATCFAISKVSNMSNPLPQQPYYMSIKAATFADGVSEYFNALFA